MSLRGFGGFRNNSARYCEPNAHWDSKEERFSYGPHCAKKRRMDDDLDPEERFSYGPHCAKKRRMDDDLDPEERFSYDPHCAKKRRKDDDLDPGPAFPRRSVSTNRNARGRGWRSYSGQRNAGNDQQRNRLDIPPLMGLNLEPRLGEARRPRYQPQSHRGGRAGFRNVNAFDNRANAGNEQNQAYAYRRDFQFNHHRGNTNNRKFDRNTQSVDRSNIVKYQRSIGFKWLEEIAQSENQDALTKLTENKTAFIELIQSPIERYDVFVLVIGCIAKVCQSSFDELKLNLLRDIINSNFIVSLKSYLMDLPYPKAKVANSLYWNDQDGFWISLITFFESMIHTSPTLALDKCRSLVEGISTASLDGLKEKHSYVLPEEYTNKLKDLREMMDNFVNIKVAEKKSRRQFVPKEGSPPEDFRELSIMPTREDLLVKRPFIRPNIVNGAYQDVEHYLDVQFRLLREDCFGPLRDGLCQYIEDPKRKRYDHIRIVHNVKFVKPFVSQTKVGSFVQIDVASNKNFKRINWRNSKRFIFGSLVLFTKDNCKSFLVGTILDREEKYLMEGLIPVSLMGDKFNERLYNDGESYTMIESEVYFEPYFHVLRALQDRSFPEHIAMKQYIVDVNPDPKHPSYLQPDTEFVLNLRENNKVMLRDSNHEYGISDNESDSEPDKVEPENDNEKKIKFTVLQDDSWPDKDTLQFNESQLEAYKLALTHEFAVIQGPPGTGKTYLGIKVAKTLYKNLKKERRGCLMLVICYTNHALDQFLEALLKVTPSIARIGGQSRNEAMDPINITRLRRNVNSHSDVQHVYVSQKLNLKSAVSKFQNALVELDVLLNGVMKSVGLTDIPEVVLLSKFYNVHLNQDALYRWLFEHCEEYYVDMEELFQEIATINDFSQHEKETRRRTGVHLDDQKISESDQMAQRARISSFTIEGTNSKIKELIKIYNECPDTNEQRKYFRRIRNLALCKELFYDMSQHRSRRINVEITENTNFNCFTPEDRWALYFMWIHNKIVEKKDTIGTLQAGVEAASTAYEEARMLLDMKVLQDKKVIGMTTSGAARMRKLLQTLAPPIVIVEEAAEVLEQHIITSLTKSCKHLILIGDHQQLRPSASHMRLAKHYNIEVSLFERMIANGMHSRRLGVQHRMRPEIAELICPHIYTDLQNHPTVYDFPDVLGVTKNLFFFTHEHREQEVVENMSRTNHEEADLVLAFANYLMQQGYTADDVTILTAYKGQMFYMRKESNKYTHLMGVNITVVDNYQGEESKIILLSLVRNNEENRIGFLGTANRICVALSRAKEGFFMFGNIENLKASSELWQSIATTLENGDSIGTSLTLKCQNHVNNLTAVSKVSDFEEVPEGGCKAPCNAASRRCGHKCLLLFCHGYDREHSTNFTRCPKPCERVLCDLGHVCPMKCAQACEPCKVLVTKKLPCGHEGNIRCHLEPDDENVKCYTPVEVKLPNCGHMAQKLCHSNIKNVQCLVKCDYRIDQCGHTCSRSCHVKDDPEHAKYICKKACARAKRGCTAGLDGDRGDHQCLKKCYETCDECCVMVNKKRTSCNHSERVTCITDVDEKRCTKNCARKLPCNHFCKKLCWETCGDCKVMVTKEIPDCKHEATVFCSLEPKRANCTLKCERMMSCGHKCTGWCKNSCDPTVCTKPSDRQVAAPCGHTVTLPCNMATLSTVEEAVLVRLCTVSCGAELACGHICGGSCSACRRGALHVPCTQTCHQINICEHQCEEPCNQICPPCKKPCEVRCQHSRCRQQCGMPCTTCKEPCTRGCTHGGACKKRCGEPCTHRACDEQCPLQLACGHPCRGVCGEPCPPVCKICDPDGFPLDFLGDEFDDDAKFILLQDCGHVMEVENMDTLMMGDRDAIEIRKCPLCRKPIINTRRYKDLVNAIFKREINPIKIKIYGTKHQIETKKKEVYDKTLDFREKYFTVLNVSANIRKVYLNLQTVAKTSQKVSKIQLDMLSICLNILEMISANYKQFMDDKQFGLHVYMKTELDEQTKILCDVFTFRVNAGVMLKISEQQQKDMNREIKRLHAIVQLAKLMQNGSYASAKGSPVTVQAHDTARAAVLSWTAFDEEKTIAKLNEFREALKVAGVISKQERDLIVRVMGMKAGAWYKCPKGHFYCIGACGGAMEESKCADCGARIGGRSHTLIADNAHAGEIDGSRAPAWPIHNDMANYRL